MPAIDTLMTWMRCFAMTLETKIGLVLGLMFIAIFAVLLNEEWIEQNLLGYEDHLLFILAGLWGRKGKAE